MANFQISRPNVMEWLSMKLPSTELSNQRGVRRRFLGGLLGMGTVPSLPPDNPLRPRVRLPSPTTSYPPTRLPRITLAEAVELRPDRRKRRSLAANRLANRRKFSIGRPRRHHPHLVHHRRPSSNHLKEIVIRVYWDGNAKPSVEIPVGDFFGLNLGQYVVYQSAYLNCSSIKALNCYFAMPFRKSARITVTNEGTQQ